MHKAQKNLTPLQALHHAQALFSAQQLQECENLCRQILQAKPDFHPAQFQLGLIAVQVNRLTLAAELIERAIQMNPVQADYHRAIGEIYRRIGNYARAIYHGEQASKISPEDIDISFNLGLAYNDAGRYEDSVISYRKVIAAKPEHSEAHNNLGSCFERLGDESAALDAYKKAAASNSKNAQAQNNLGALLSARGELDEARKCFELSIAANPNFVHAHYNLSSLKKYTIEDPHLKVLENIITQAENLPEYEQTRYWFAIGKAREDIGNYDGAFEGYQKGNLLKRRTFYYNPAENEALADQIINQFTNDFFSNREDSGYTDNTPVFIIGMPRSGSTLVEQILSSHSKVFGAGELSDLDQVINFAKSSSLKMSYIDWLKDLDASEFSSIGEHYIQRLRAIDPKTPLITDKMPANFFYAGLIKIILPNAKIIHTTRHPMDTCLSNYSRLFNESMYFTYDLEDLGKYYSTYNRLMKHWHTILPKGSILDVRYEDVVDNIEEQARRILEYCGLNWEKDCLAFYKNKRHVKTASIAQVRQPLYKNSVARWERFGKQLDPLRNILENAGVL